MPESLDDEDDDDELLDSLELLDDGDEPESELLDVDEAREDFPPRESLR